jgi:hypothetical protein
MFRKCLKIEFSRAFHSLSTWLVLLVGIGISVFHFIRRVIPAAEFIIDPPFGYPASVFNSSLMLDFQAAENAVYYYVIPLLAVLPFGWSYISDLQDGYFKSIAIRTDKRKFMLAKYLAVFVSAGTMCMSIAVFDLILTMTEVAPVIPKAGIALLPIFGNYFLADVYFTHPFLYVGFYLLMGFLLAGGLAVLAIAVSNFVTNRYIALFFPFALFMVLHAILPFIGLGSYDPFQIVCPLQYYIPNMWTFLIELPVLLITGFAVYWIGGCRRDVI